MKLDYEHLLPEDTLFPPMNERDAEAPLKQQPWKRDDVWAYREALVRLGLSTDAIEDLIERDCGREFCERPMLLVRQAS